MNFKIARGIALGIIALSLILPPLLHFSWVLKAPLAGLMVLSIIFLLFSSKISQRIWAGDNTFKKIILFIVHIILIIISAILAWFWLFIGAVGY